jgi:hypothetical protein
LELDPYNLPLLIIMTVHALCTKLLRGEPLRVVLPHETDEMLCDVLTAQPGHATVPGDETLQKRIGACRSVGGECPASYPVDSTRL